jgi:hypothetical protein
MPAGRQPFTFTAARVALVAALTLSCADNGPGWSDARFVLRPSLGAAGIVPLAEARLVLQRSGGEAVADQVVDIAPGDSTVNFAINVTLRSPDELFQLTIQLITPEGDTAFRAGPLSVQAGGTSGNNPSPVEVAFTYDGVGKEARSIQIVTTDFPPLSPGDTLFFDALAMDSLGQPVDSTPIEWTTPDGSTATVTTLGPPTYRGRVIGAGGGNARIVARLLTNQAADTSGVSVVVQGSGTIWSTGGDGTEMATIDRATGLGSTIGPQGFTQGWAAAFDLDGTLYTLVNGFSASAILGTVNQTTGAVTLIGNGVGASMISLEFSAAGVLYGIGYSDGILYQINKTTGVGTAIGTGTGISLNMDLAFNSAGTLLATVGDQLWTVNTTTGTSTLLGTVTNVCPGGQIMAIMFDANDVLYATTYATADASCLLVINLATMSATTVGLTGLHLPHGGDIR